MIKKLVISTVLLFSASAFADSSSDVALAYECADSLYTYDYGTSTFAQSCTTLFNKDSKTSVLSVLENALKEEIYPVGIDQVEIKEAIRIIQATNIIGSKIYLKDDY